jgi:uncharacterized protein (TIGR02453 family)
MAYFTKETIKFLSDLKKNNNREWFNDNKTQYIAVVKDPFEVFIGDLIEAMNPYFESLPIAPKDAIFRIYRDVRFSKNKTPYKTNVSAIISPGGRKDKTMPGIYLEISPDEIRVYSGLYQLDAKQLYNIRSHISHNLEQFQSLISNPAFIKIFTDIKGEKNKRIQKDFDVDAIKQPLLFNKQFYYFTSWPLSTIYQDELVKKVTDTFEVAQPVSEFLYEGIF